MRLVPRVLSTPRRRLAFVFAAAAVMLLCLAFAPVAAAHVKWFSQTVALQDRPLPLSAIVNRTFFALAGLSAVVIVGLSLADDAVQKVGWYAKLRDGLRAREPHARDVMRVTTGMSLLLSWQAGVVLAPELAHSSALISWLQFAAILCLLDTRTTPITGMLVWVLFAIGAVTFGLFHMLDYVAFVGIGFYLLFHASKRQSLRSWVKPALFATTGLSLSWLAMEKLVFPTWGIVLLEQNPALTMGLPTDFFLTAAAFVEFSLGYLLLIGVLGRPLAIIITVVFFTTSIVFGKDEVVGHLILHGVLVVFMLEGTRGPFAPPFRIHDRKLMRVAFVSVNFALLLGLMLVGYQGMAEPRNLKPVAHADLGSVSHQAAAVEVGDGGPTVALTASALPSGGWRLDIETTAFRLSSTASRPRAGEVPTAGHVHLFVDGEMRMMVFSSPHEIEPLAPGRHEIVVQLSGADHQALTRGGVPIEARAVVTQP